MEANPHRRLFSQRLKGLMNRRLPDRMKHAELAQLLSERFPDRAKGPYTHGWVSHKLSGDQGVRLDELHALADIFNTTVSYLVGETDDEHRPVTYLDDPLLEPEDQMDISDMIAGRRLRRLQERQRRASGIPDARGDS